MEQFDDQQSMRGFGDYWAIVVRRRWWIIGPLFIGWLLVFLSAWVIPAKYTSETVILVEQQKIPEHYVLPNVQVDLGERLQAITQQVLSRTRLLGIINELHLYQSFLTPTPDDQINAMRKDIKIDLVQAPTQRAGQVELTGFKLSYAADKASIAQQVNTRLAGFFVDENVRQSQLQSESTTNFLDSQLRAAASSLAEQEARLGEFQKKHIGQLPSELQSNTQVLGVTESQLQAAIDQRNRAIEQQTYLTSLAAQYDALGPDAASGGPQSIDQQIQNARTSLADMQAKYTNDHPDIKKMKDTIAKLEQLKQQQDSEAKSAMAGTTDSDANKDTDKSASAEPPAGGPAPSSKAMQALMELQSKIKANKIEIQTKDAEIKRLEEKAAAYQARISAEPQVEAEMSDLSRGLEQSKKSYDDLLAKRNMSGTATNLERQQLGEQFRVIDPPSLPDKASFPDRFKFSLAGLGLGVFLAVIGLGLEFMDDRIRSEHDLVAASPLPVLAEVPPLPTEREIAAARWKPWVALAAAILVAIIIPSGILYAFYWG